MLHGLLLLRWVWRGIIFVVGATVLLVGVVLIFTPGPAVVVIPLGLMILATEFAWARVILALVKERIERLRPKTESRPTGEPAPPPPEPTRDGS